MYYYHGTTLENAIKILSERMIKGKKAEQKHKNRYVSLTKSKSVARQYGEVVLRFDSEKLVKTTIVNYTKKSWVKDYPEMVEFILKGCSNTDELVGVQLQDKKADKEVVLFNKYNFAEDAVDICLVGEDASKLNELKEALQPYLLEIDKVTKTKK